MLPPLGPEPSASTNSAIWATARAIWAAARPQFYERAPALSKKQRGTPSVKKTAQSTTKRQRSSDSDAAQSPRDTRPRAAKTVVLESPSRRQPGRRDVDIPSRERILEHLRESGVPMRADEHCARSWRRRNCRARSVRRPRRRNDARWSVDDESQRPAVRRRQARSRDRDSAGTSGRIRLSRSRRRRSGFLSSAERDAQGAARRSRDGERRSASTSADGPRA